MAGTRDPALLADLAKGAAQEAARAPQAVALLRTIPGVEQRTAEGMVGRDRRPDGAIRRRGPARLLGGHLPREPRIHGEARGGYDAEGLQMVHTVTPDFTPPE